jgi:response regulator RpfG family c-di-GMP phosphodiesterase
MSDKILFVDDDPNLLAACERTLRKQFQLDTADGGKAGLEKIAARGPYAVIVSDRQMPLMDGIQFLSVVRQVAPETVRIMLTGNVDLEAAVRVVNEGNIFRFLIKPCPQEILAKALQDGLAQHRLVTAEKELLNQTLSGGIKLLTDILSAVDVKAFGRGERLRDLINELTAKLSLDNAWEIHLANMLAPIGYVTLPPETLVKTRGDRILSRPEEQLIAGLPETAARLLANIPRLDGVARIVRYHRKRFDGSGLPQDAVRGDALPAGARLLKILLDMQELQSDGQSPAHALNEMQQRRGWYDPNLLAVVRATVGGKDVAPSAARPNISVAVAELTVGMVLYSDLLTRDGTLVLSAGHRITPPSLQRIQNFAQLSGVKEPLFVEAPPGA